ncbi:MAG: hypothetical protein L0H29_02875, partial [Sinobacteraceae bacterium]|nr:hypothetical protein [Nevskiaceae bacterium]
TIVSMSGCGLQGGDPALYGGAPNYFQYRVMDGPGNYDHHPVPLEWDMPNGQIYFQSLFLEYHANGFDVRLGQQQIAWGNTIFFRVFDTANGLDLRRHSLFDYAQEEFADKRVPAPALRVMWQATHDINVDAYVEKFQPTMLGNPETSYNAIPSQFTVYDHYKDFETRLNEAIRIQWHGTQWSLEAMFGRRYNPWGAYSWTQSQVDRYYPYLPKTLPLPTGDVGVRSAGTPFSSNPTGATSAYEWFNYAGMYRFNGMGALNTGIAEFPDSQALGGAVVPTPQGAFYELNTFHNLSNGLRGYLARQYFHEYNIGLGAGYTTNTGSANSFWNQILIHLEVRYTPNRTLTSPDVSTHFLRTNDWIGALEIEKYYRFIQALPSTYMVLEYMHRERTDLFGRALAGYGAHPYVPTDPSCMNTSGCTSAQLAPRTDPRPHGISGANYIVFAAQQPFANHVWSAAFATLFDVHGGILVQPAVQWAPSSHWRMTMFYNYVNGHMWGNPNNNLFGKTSQYANEFAMRVQYAF